MPASGGASDKLGNRYEGWWAIDQLLRIIDGTALRLTLEPLDLDKSKGIEFSVAKADGTAEYWSVKRQTTKAGGGKSTTLANVVEKLRGAGVPVSGLWGFSECKLETRSETKP